MPIPGPYSSIDFGNPACFTNGGTAITDLSGNSRDFTLNNTNYTYNATTGSILMAADNQAVGTPSEFVLGTNAYTFTCWVKFKSSSNSRIFYFGSGGGALGRRFYNSLQPGGNLHNIDNSSAAQQATPIPFDNQWHFLAVTKPSSGTVGQQLTYVDGVLIPQGADFNPSALVDIQTPDTAVIHHFEDGTDLEIATFTLYSSVLSSGDLTELYTNDLSRFLFPDCELDFGDPASFTNGGTAITDLSGNGKNWTLDNTTYTFDASVGAVLLPGGLQAQGNNTQYAYGTAAFSILTWIKLDSYPGSSNICLIGPDGGGTRIFYFLDPPSQTVVDNGSGVAVQSPVTYDSDWHLVALTRPANGLVQDQKLFIDGVLIPNTAFYNPTQPLSQGSGGYAIIHSGFNPQPITLATFKIYLSDLNSAGLTEIYNSEVSRFTPTPPLPPVTGLSNGRRFGQGFPQ